MWFASTPPRRSNRRSIAKQLESEPRIAPNHYPRRGLLQASILGLPRLQYPACPQHGTKLKMSATFAVPANRNANPTRLCRTCCLAATKVLVTMPQAERHLPKKTWACLSPLAWSCQCHATQQCVLLHLRVCRRGGHRFAGFVRLQIVQRAKSCRLPRPLAQIVRCSSACERHYIDSRVANPLVSFYGGPVCARHSDPVSSSTEFLSKSILPCSLPNVANWIEQRSLLSSRATPPKMPHRSPSRSHLDCTFHWILCLEWRSVAETCPALLSDCTASGGSNATLSLPIFPSWKESPEKKSGLRLTHASRMRSDRLAYFLLPLQALPRRRRAENGTSECPHEKRHISIQKPRLGTVHPEAPCGHACPRAARPACFHAAVPFVRAFRLLHPHRPAASPRPKLCTLSSKTMTMSL